MSGTTALQRTDTDLAARKVARRVNGDLQSMIEKLALSSGTDISDLVHDLQVGLTHDCIETLTPFLYAKGAGRDDARRVYRYRRVARGSFTESPHSGRISQDIALHGGRIEFEVHFRDRSTWEKLKTNGKLKIRWTNCEGRSTAGMSESGDGGYGSGAIGLSRSCFVRSY